MARVARTRLALPWLLILSVAWPASSLAVALKDVEFASLPGNQVRIELVFTEAVAPPPGLLHRVAGAHRPRSPGGNE